MKKLNLDDLEKAQHTVTLRGVEYRVRPVTPRVGLIIESAGAVSGSERLVKYVDAVCLLVPLMSRDDVEGLSVPQLVAIVELAGTEADAVEAAVADPNAPRPTPKKAVGRIKTATA